MKIAMLGVKAVPAIGGIAHYCEELGSRLATRGHQVTIYCRPHYLNGDHRPYYRGIQRRVCQGIRTKHLDTITHTLSALADALRRHYDILHFHGIGPGVLAPVASRAGRTQVVVTSHGRDWRGAKWGPLAKRCLKFANRVALGSADAVVAVSRVDQEVYRRVWGRDVRFIPTGMDIRPLADCQEIRRFGLEPDGYMLSMGRLSPEKGCHHLLSAYRALSTTKRLVFAGEARGAERYAARLRATADSRVVFTGMASGRLKEELLSNAWLFVQPSEMEGLSIAILEALAHGRCVVASDIPANAEALGDCGFRFRSRDVADLARLLGLLLRRDDLVRAEFVKAREHIARERSWDVNVTLHEQLYESLCGKGEAG